MDDFVFKLNTKLLYILEITSPTVSVVFSMDGPAPLAKLLTQRARRQVCRESSGGPGAPWIY